MAWAQGEGRSPLSVALRLGLAHMTHTCQAQLTCESEAPGLQGLPRPLCVCVCVHTRVQAVFGDSLGGASKLAANSAGSKGSTFPPYAAPVGGKAPGRSQGGRCAVRTPLEGPNGDGKAWGAGKCAGAGQLPEQEARAGQATVTALLTQPLQAPSRTRRKASAAASQDPVQGGFLEKTGLRAAPCQAPLPGAPPPPLVFPHQSGHRPSGTGSLPPPEVQQLLSLPPTPQG